VKYISSHREDEFLSKHVSIPHFQAEEKTPTALSPYVRLYSLGKALQEQFPFKFRPEYENVAALAAYEELPKAHPHHPQ
jgi:hypothetical protein